MSYQEARGGESARAGLAHRIKTHIEKNLEDPALGPKTLADQFGISVRYLHLLFAGEDQTVSRWILGRRLERCRHDLMVAGPLRISLKRLLDGDLMTGHTSAGSLKNSTASAHVNTAGVKPFLNIFFEVAEAGSILC